LNISVHGALLRVSWKRRSKKANPPIYTETRKPVSMTPLQRRNLQLYLRFREHSPTVSALLWANRRNYLILLSALGGLGGFFYLAVGGVSASFFAVAFVISVLRDIGHYRRSIDIWPVLRQVLDWNKIDQLAQARVRRNAFGTSAMISRNSQAYTDPASNSLHRIEARCISNR